MFMFTGDEFSLISGFTKFLCSPENRMASWSVYIFFVISLKYNILLFWKTASTAHCAH